MDSGKEQMSIFAVLDDKGEFSGFLEMGMFKVNEGNFTVKYYNHEQALASIDYSYNKVENKIYFSNIKNKTENAMANKDCGQATADCIVGAYSHHGWMSVTLWVETAVIPETGIAIAGACAIKNCM